MDRPAIEALLTEPVLVLIGPTAVGKTALSLALAERFSCEIVGLDSMQIYRHMDIGTAKATPEDRIRVVHHLLDVVNPDEEYHVAR
ncbi:MAG: isopentenyl transferase family protein, partial [Desulfobulbia bacterium]